MVVGLHLPMQSLPITTDVVSSNLDRARCTTLCDKACQWLARGRWFSPGPPVSSTNKTDCHDITERLLNMVLNTIKQTNITGSFRISALCQWEVFYMFFGWLSVVVVTLSLFHKPTWSKATKRIHMKSMNIL